MAKKVGIELDQAELVKQLGGPFVKVEVAAKVLGIPAEKVRTARARGDFPGSFQLGDETSCHWLIPVPSLKAWLEGRQAAGHVAPREARVRGQPASRGAKRAAARDLPAAQVGGPFMKLEDAARASGLKQREVKRLIQAGELPGSYRPGGNGHWLVPWPRLEAWVKRQQATTGFAPRPQTTRSEQAVRAAERRRAKAARAAPPPVPAPAPKSARPRPAPVVRTTVAVTRQAETLWLFPEVETAIAAET